MTRKCGKKNQEVLEAIEKFIKDNGISPTIRELCDMVGLSSTSTVHGHIKRLKNNNLIEYNPNSPRSIRIVKETHFSNVQSSKFEKENQEFRVMINDEKIKITLEDVPGWIKNERLKNRLSVKEVSKSLNIDYDRLSDCENGNICFDTRELRRIFDYYGSKVEVVFY